MTIKELQTKYSLPKEDFWEVRTGIWVVTHNACEKIASIENIEFHKPDVYTENGIVALLGTAKMGDKTIWATGEASPTNVKGQGSYLWAMAEKRLKDRLTLKLINAYEYGIYSEEESESFNKK